MNTRNTPKQQSLQTTKPLMRLVQATGKALALALLVSGVYYMSSQQEAAVAYESGSFEEVLQLATTEDKLCFVSFETDFCYPCQALSRRFQADAALQSVIREQYTPYRVDPFSSYSGGNSLAQLYGIEHLPTILITDSEGKELHRIEDITQWDSLQAVLLSQATLRSAPSPESNSLLSSREVPIHIAIDTTGAEDEDYYYFKRYGLQVGTYGSYQEAQEAAGQRQRMWNQAIWIQPHRRGYELVIGDFGDKKSARLTRKFLQLWEDVPSKIATLRETPLAVSY